MRTPAEVARWVWDYTHEEGPGCPVAHDFTLNCEQCIQALIDFITNG